MEDRRASRVRSIAQAATYTLLASYLPAALAQSCISLSGSRTCPGFNASSFSTDSTLVGFFPFLSSVTNVSNFDSGIQNYIANGWAQTHWQNVLGCSNINTSNTTALYARYTTSFLCNAIVQNSIGPCGLTGNATRPLCADSCASFALSEEAIVNSNVCGSSASNAVDQLRADFTRCALPADSLSGLCVSGAHNEPDNCGFSNNLGSLCSYCAASSPNATDSCCVFSNTTSRCQGVSLPIIASTALAAVTVTTTPSSSYSSSSSDSSSGSGLTGAGYGSTSHGLTGGQIAGIVVGAVLGALLLLALIIVGCILFRKRHASSPATSIFEQPGNMQENPYTDGTRDVGLAVPFGARVARMSALESSSADGSRGGYRKSTSSESETPHSRGATSLAPPTTAKRSGSLSSGSALGMGALGDTSPSSGNEAYTSPDSHGQSEQLAFFKDYYSQDEIHSGDIVSTLWAYEPRAADEFTLERGDMIKVLGIWDDGWATGVRVRQRAEDWRPSEKIQRDSGMSNGSSRPPDTSEGEGEVKAFPLVCVCLPQHWRKTIEGESTENTGDY